MGLIRTGVLVLMVLFLPISLSFGQNTFGQFWIKGVEHAAQGNFNEAKVEFEKVLKVDPFNGPAKRALKVIEDVTNQKIKSNTANRLFKGESYFLKRQWAKAMVEFNKAIEINPGYAQSYFRRGGHYVQKGQHDKAIADYNKAIEINPKFAEAYMSRGGTYEQKGQYDKAIADYNKAIEINPKLAEAYVARGYYYAQKDQYENAIADYSKAIETSPEYYMAYLLRMQFYHQKGQYDKAITDANKAIEIKPNWPEAYLSRGLIYMEGFENKDKACSDWSRACDLGRCMMYKFAKTSGKCE
jgi:tetratricopeptide (TPR) repeat protein